MDGKAFVYGLQIGGIVMAAYACLKIGMAVGNTVKNTKKNVCPGCGTESSGYSRVCPECGYLYKADIDKKESLDGRRFSRIFEKIEKAAVDEVAAFHGDIAKFLEMRSGSLG